ncbi:MAG: phosphodiester glycosidase family protein [Anaeromicrobium sp.]|jgi:exopolysaccharide biosynthesis protein|uniref:phosphodiester glycosidase family protein n=1 Tax=Anaeromicrobium sp. TaxID=1929132 RepID=UPI0026002A03|nr:phosphodiester glycosidase family protein [Anaeromicrobium sp.]MCT4593574.1 phosphodiester glycosidase family protein [Anaeromicrobium sp.]
MSKINIFFLFLLAPFIGIFMVSQEFVDESKYLVMNTASMSQSVESLGKSVEDLEESIEEFGLIVEQQKEVFNQQNELITELSDKSDNQRKLSNDIYEQKILEMLGPAVKTHISSKTEIKIFKLAELGYRGYIAKIKLFDPNAFKVVLGKDTLGKLETTSKAAKRIGGILAINGGGFYTENRNGKSYAQLIGNTVINGNLVEPFNGYPGDLFFTGINKRGQVIGTVPKTEGDIMNLNPYQGVSFTPVLIRDFQKIQIPSKWAKTNQPRTIIGKYSNDDLIMIVIDGRQEKWSKGVSLERVQDKLLELGVKEAYNLDGGGSSAMYYNGALLNRPSDGRERPVVNNIVIMP